MKKVFSKTKKRDDSTSLETARGKKAETKVNFYRFSSVSSDIRPDNKREKVLGYFRLDCAKEIKLVKETLKNNGFEQVGDEKWNILWTTKLMRSGFYHNMAKNQRIN